MIHRNNEEELHNIAEELSEHVDELSEQTERWSAMISSARNGQIAAMGLLHAKQQELAQAKQRIAELEEELEAHKANKSLPFLERLRRRLSN